MQMLESHVVLPGCCLCCCAAYPVHVLQMLSIGVPLALGQVVGLATLPAVFGWCVNAILR
jgi:hypothetical protein